jgi:S1-C subfamily serine protease
MLRIGRGFAVSASWLGVTVQPVTTELADGAARAETSLRSDDQGSTAFGFDVADVPAEVRRQLDLGEAEGALVARVYRGGSAESAGLRAGDLIEEVDRSHVSGRLDAGEELREAGDKALLVVQRDHRSFSMALERRKE